MPYPTSAGPAGTNANAAMDEQAIKRRLYEEALDRFAGFEPGESQLSDEQIMARRAAMAQAAGQAPGQMPGQMQGQMPGAMPGQMGAPGARGAGGAPFEAVLAQLRARPGMIEHLEGIDLDGDGLPDIPLGPPPMDPMGRMQWEQAMGQRQQMQQAAQMRRAQRKAVNNQVLLAVLQQSDPLFGHTYARLNAYVESLPEKVRRTFLESVERTPGAFLDLYTHLRGGIERAPGSSRSAHEPMPRHGDADPRARIRQAVAGRMGAPVLEQAGYDDARLSGATRDAERAHLVRRIKAGGARDGDLVRYMELAGF